jgi:SAM-dependent methyltransferase
MDKYLIEYIPFYKGVMLDLGCGNKPFEDFFTQHVDKYVGVDWTNCLHDSKADIVADLNKKLPIEDGYADTVVSLNVLEHLYNPQLFLKESYRVLKDGGVIILHIPFQWWVHEAPHDYFRYTPYGLRRLLDEAGFMDIKVQPTAGFFTTILMKINYFSLRAMKGSKFRQIVTKNLLKPFWYMNQKLAPILDNMHRGWSLEAQSFFVVAKKQMSNQTKNGIKIIASLTSYGERAETAHLAIETILNQTLKADKVILWLAEDEFNENNIPNSLKKLRKNGLIIDFCEDIKSYKKLIPTLKKYPNDIIITFDDDIYYKNDVIEKLYNSYLQEPKSIHCMRGHKINFQTLNKVAPYDKWGKQWYQEKSSFFIIPTGAGGVLYPPESLHVDTCKDFIFMDIAPTSDDLWFKTMSLIKGTKCKVLSSQVGYSNDLNTIGQTQNVKLWDINKSENDKAIYKLFDKYNLYEIFHKESIAKERIEQFKSILSYSFTSSLKKDDLHEKLIYEYQKKKIEAEISKYNDDKEFFWDIALFFRENQYFEYEQKSLNRYFAYKCVQFRDSLTNTSTDKIVHSYENLYQLFEQSKAKKVFQHYIFAHILLSGIKPNGYEKKINLSSCLTNIRWENKSYLYESLVQEIVKVDNKQTKSAVIVISNGMQEYINETLKEIKKQQSDDYKVIFVSNNRANQTEEILSLVDTFVQMQENNGAYLARNVGSIFAFSDILIFLEDDGIPENDFVKLHEKCYNTKDVISVRGCCLPKTQGQTPEHYWLGMHSKPAPTMLEGNCSFRAKEFYEIGGWGDYIMFGHGGAEICHRMLASFSKPNRHIYSPRPILYHDWSHSDKNQEMKEILQHASWQVLKFSYDDFHLIFKRWEN